MDKMIDNIIKKYKYTEGTVIGYQGGYPIVQLTFNNNTLLKYTDQKQLDKIVRNAEIVKGRELGVGLNFRRTAYAKVEGDTIIVSGYVTIIERILEDLS